ncbi:MAG TPA: SRPBCC family protein [Candidatus Acidoferrales bacterium]|nr:SRPBCC family protein [Candidatus Acidoferrales bacterium]
MGRIVGTGRIVLEFDLALLAPPARAFAAVTEGRHLERWFCDACESEAEDGGRLTMRWHRRSSTVWPYQGTWTEFDAPTRCRCRGGHEGYPRRDAGEITFVVEPHGTGALLRVRHEFPDVPEYEPFARGFRESWPRALERLRHYLAPAARA